MMLFGGYLFLFCILILPGLAFFLFLKQRMSVLFDRGMMFMVSPISIALFSPLLLFAYSMKMNLASVGYIIVGITVLSLLYVVLMVSKRGVSSCHCVRGAGSPLYYGLLLIFCAGIFYAIADALKINLAFTADSLFHLGRINKIVVNAVADNFNPVSGSVIELGRGYMNNYYHLLLAVLTVVTGLEAVGVWFFFQYMNLFLFIFLSYSFTTLFFSKMYSFFITTAIFSVIFFFLPYAPNLTGAYTSLYPYTFLFFNYPNAYVEKIIFVSALFLFFLFKKNRLTYRPFLMLTSLLFFSAAGIHLVSAFVIFFSISVFYVASFFLEKFLPPQWKERKL